MIKNNFIKSLFIVGVLHQMLFGKIAFCQTKETNISQNSIVETRVSQRTDATTSERAKNGNDSSNKTQSQSSKNEAISNISKKK